MPSSKDELVAAMERIADALQFVRGPTGEIIYLGAKIPDISWHLSRAGTDVDEARAIIKRRPVRPRFGMLGGFVDWVPFDSPDPPDLPELVSAVNCRQLDLDKLEDALPWHVKTHIGGFK